MKRILFVCTGNSCRSVMAEGLFKKYVEDRRDEFHVTSAGISAIDGFSATPETIIVLEEEGVDMSDHQSRRLTPDMVEQADEIYVMEKIHKDWIVRSMPEAGNKVHLLMEFASRSEYGAHSDIPDPIRMSGSFYRNVLDVVDDCVKNLAASFK
jgi:protein-tyrosine-phosphatase